MPSAVASKSKTPLNDDLDNYDAGELSDDPFRTPSPEPASKKRKDPPQSGLGIDEEVSVQKRARAPAVKLDEERLLGPSGIPKLRTRAGGLKLKGKGHEFGDAARLLSFYQLWLDDLFPKAKFLDALAMVEKAGHKKRLVVARSEWISQRNRKEGDDEEQDPELLPVSTIERPTGERPSTPARDEVPGDDDLYDATPKRAGRTVPVVNDDVPDGDDLSALIAESEGQDVPRRKTPQSQMDNEEDDLDALIAEAETQDQGSSTAKLPQPTPAADFAEEEAAMLEMDGLW